MALSQLKVAWQVVVLPVQIHRSSLLYVALQCYRLQERVVISTALVSDVWAAHECSP